MFHRRVHPLQKLTGRKLRNSSAQINPLAEVLPVSLQTDGHFSSKLSFLESFSCMRDHNPLVSSNVYTGRPERYSAYTLPRLQKACSTFLALSSPSKTHRCPTHRDSAVDFGCIPISSASLLAPRPSKIRTSLMLGHAGPCPAASLA